MSLSCQRSRELLPLYAAEALDGGERRGLRAHLADCEPCRAEAGRCDEGLLFAFAEADEVAAQDVERILAGIRAGLDWRRVERRIAPPRPARGRRGFLAAAAALVAFLLGFPELSTRGPAPVRVAPPVAAARREPGPPAEPAVSQVQPAGLSPADAPGGAIPAKATVYDWNPGSGQPRVVWIVDRSLDI